VEAVERTQGDRLGELVNIGAGHAAGAFAPLVGRPMLMSVPHVGRGGAKALADLPGPARSQDGEWAAGVFFELEGEFDALVGILFSDAARSALLRAFLGSTKASPGAVEVDSVLMEAGNILVSHVASAIADTLAGRILPTIPVLANRWAEAQFAAFVAQNEADRTPVRIDCELHDSEGGTSTLLVVIPRI